MTQTDAMAGIPPETFSGRRARVFDALGRGVMVLQSAPVMYRSRDTEYGYRPDSELFYLTGAIEAGTVAVLIGGEEPRFLLFVEERDEEAELWSGPRLGIEGARARFHADETHPISQLDERLPAILQRADRMHVRLGRGDALEQMVVEALTAARLRGARKGGGPRGIVDPGEILDEMRLVKDSHEIQRIRHAAWISTEGHREAFTACGTGVGEWTIQAAVDAAFRAAGAQGPGFGTIVGAGANACVLHYVDNGHTVDDGELVLVDAGAEFGLYHGDVTRTFPGNGHFTHEQRAVYDVVEEARAAAVAAAGPGVAIEDVHLAAVRVMVRGLVDMKALSGGVDDLVEQAAYKPFAPHHTSHWLGLDVHDPGDYVRDGQSRLLVPGMVFTVEPGLYFRPGVSDGAARFAGTGVRIEDDVLVTKDGVENLTASLPTAAEEIEALVQRTA